METKIVKFTCSQCKKEIEQETDVCIGGYALNEKEEKICFLCCAENDKQYMRDNGKITLYLSEVKDSTLIKHVINWPGSLRIQVDYHKIGRHNICGKRIDVWFRFNGFVWHGVQMGRNNDMVSCKQTKKTRF